MAALSPISQYLSKLKPAERAALNDLRKTILSVAKGAEEVISYGIPTLKLYGHLVGFAAFKQHLSFFLR